MAIESPSEVCYQKKVKVLAAQSFLTITHGLYIARQAPLSMEFPRQEYWRGLTFPPLGDLPKSGIELASLGSPALAGGCFFVFFFFTTELPGKLCILL